MLLGLSGVAFPWRCAIGGKWKLKSEGEREILASRLVEIGARPLVSLYDGR